MSCGGMAAPQFFEGVLIGRRLDPQAGGDLLLADFYQGLEFPRVRRSFHPRSSPQNLLRRKAKRRRRRLALSRTWTPHPGDAHKNQTGPQLQGSKGSQMPLHFSDTSREMGTLRSSAIVVQRHGSRSRLRSRRNQRCQCAMRIRDLEVLESAPESVQNKHRWVSA